MCETLIKIIVPVYKTEQYLDRCIKSILDQTEQNFEVVLVDDGSPDNCPQLCECYKRKDHRIHVIHQQNKGLSEARNAGLNYKLESNYITFIDSDDWIQPHYLEAMIRATEENKCPLAICRHEKSDGKIPLVNKKKLYGKVFSSEECYCMTDISTTPAWGKLYKSELFDKLRFPIGKIYEDYYTTWKAVFKAQRVAVIRQPLYSYYINSTGITQQPWTPKKMDVFPALEEKISYFGRNDYKLAQKRAIFKIIKLSEKQLICAQRDDAENERIRDLEVLQKNWKGQWNRKYGQWCDMHWRMNNDSTIYRDND